MAVVAAAGEAFVYAIVMAGATPAGNTGYTCCRSWAAERRCRVQRDTSPSGVSSRSLAEPRSPESASSIGACAAEAATTQAGTVEAR